MRLLSDEQLTRLATGGDRRAFAAIYERHHQGLYRYCCSILRSPDDAHDALQSTWLAAVRGLQGERREISLKAWLYRVAHNESISLARRRRPQDELADDADLPAAEQPDTRDALGQLISDLRVLPERQRTAIVLRELSGLSYEEIGASLEISAAAATQTVYAARKGLHELRDGRELHCDAVQRSISLNDRRVMRARKLRAHLRVCADCREFDRALTRRPAELAMLVPPLPATAAAAILRDVLSAGAVGAAPITAAGAGTAGVLGSSAAIKAAIAASAVALGSGASLVATYAHRAPARSAPPSAAQTALGAADSSAAAARPNTARPPAAARPPRPQRQSAPPPRGTDDAPTDAPRSAQQAPVGARTGTSFGEPREVEPTATSSPLSSTTTRPPDVSSGTREQPLRTDAAYPGGSTQQRQPESNVGGPTQQLPAATGQPPTAAPTAAPTSAPTSAPPAAPTATSTGQPSTSPSPGPSSYPSAGR